MSTIDIPLALLSQYHTMHARAMTDFTVGITPSPRTWQLLDSTLHFMNDLQLTELAKKLSPSAARKIRNTGRLKKNVRVYQWVAGGDASDYLCSRYVNTIWSAAYTMPVPGDATNMNDSHINCQCYMEFIGFADAKGNITNDPRRAYDDDPYTAPQGVAP